MKETLILAAALIILSGSICAAVDAWRNRRKYSARERQRAARGGLD